MALHVMEFYITNGAARLRISISEFPFYLTPRISLKVI